MPKRQCRKKFQFLWLTSRYLKNLSETARNRYAKVAGRGEGCKAEGIGCIVKLKDKPGEQLKIPIDSSLIV